MNPIIPLAGLGILLLMMGGKKANAATLSTTGEGTRGPWLEPVPLPESDADRDLIARTICVCWSKQAAQGLYLEGSQLLDCVADAMHPDVPWPPIEGDHETVFQAWQIFVDLVGAWSSLSDDEKEAACSELGAIGGIAQPDQEPAVEAPPTIHPRPPGDPLGRFCGNENQAGEYNQNLWSNLESIKEVFAELGYPVPDRPTMNELGPDGELGGEDDIPNPAVEAFQNDYNGAAAAGVLGVQAGGLDRDGLVGPCTLNGLEVVLSHFDGAAWKGEVGIVQSVGFSMGFAGPDRAEVLDVLIANTPTPGRFYRIKAGDTMAQLARRALNSVIPGSGENGNARLDYIYCMGSGSAWNLDRYGSTRTTQTYPELYAINGQSLASAFIPCHENTITALLETRPPNRGADREGKRIPGVGKDYGMIWMPPVDAQVLANEGEPTCGSVTWSDGRSSIDPPPEFFALVGA